MRLLLCFFLVTASCFGQSSGAREVRLRLMAFDNSTVPAESFMFDPAAPQPSVGLAAPIKGYLNHEDVGIQLFGSDVLFSKSAKVEDIKKTELHLAKVTLPKTGNRFMLIFLPTPSGAFRILTLDDSIKEFPLGSYRVVSLSQFPVRLTLEGKAYEFKPGQSSIIADAPVQENHHSAMYAYSQVDGKWQRIGSGLWPEQGKKRSIQIFFDNPTSKQTELRGFRDVSPPVPGAEPPPSNAQAP